MRPQGDLERSMIERVQLKLFSMQQAGQALKLHSHIVANDARRLVALLPSDGYRWTSGCLQVNQASLDVIAQWQVVAGEFLQQLAAS